MLALTVFVTLAWAGMFLLVSKLSPWGWASAAFTVGLGAMLIGLSGTSRSGATVRFAMPYGFADAMPLIPRRLTAFVGGMTPPLHSTSITDCVHDTHH